MKRQATLLASRYSPPAAAMGLLAESIGIQHYRLVLGLISARELTVARVAAEGLAGQPLQLAQFGEDTGWDRRGEALFRCVVVDSPLDHQSKRERTRNPALRGVTLYSPLGTALL